MKALVSILVVGVVTMLARLLLRPDSGRVEDRTPVRVLKYGWRFRAFILLFAGLIPVVGAWAYLKGDIHDMADKVAAVLLNMFALYAFLEVFLVRITFDESGISARSPWRGSRRIAWSEIIGYDFSGWNRWHLLRTTRQGTLRLSIYLTGLDTFFEALELHAPVEPSI